MSDRQTASEKSEPSPPRSTGAGGWRWPPSEAFSVLDQLLFNGANFGFNILLARWLGLSAYGAFAVGLSVFFLAGAMHTAVLTEPMMVFGGTKYSTRFSWYVGVLVNFHWALSAIIAVALALGALVVDYLGSHQMALALWGVAAASPFILLSWLVRPACYVQRVAQFAALGSGLYALLIAATLWWLQSHGLLTVVTAFLAMGLASLISAAVVIALLKNRGDLAIGGERKESAREVLAGHWAYGSWNVVGTIAQWSSSQILFVLTPMFLNLAAVGAMSVGATLMRPLFPMIRSITPLMLSRVTADIDNPERADALRKYVFRWLAVCAGGTLCYALTLTIFYEPVSRHLFAGKYLAYRDLVLLFGLAYTASAAVQVIHVVIRAMGETRSIAFVWGTPGILTALLSIPVFLVGSLTGVVAIFALSYWMALGLTLFIGAGPLFGHQRSASLRSLADVPRALVRLKGIARS
jgi:O-antigen/teichoic acid export membrane protein